MSNLKRDEYIDTVKGLAILAVIFIHTVFWSGKIYTPEWIRNVSLMFDVPIFFLMTGCLLSLTGIKDGFITRQLLKLSFNFTIVVILFQFLFWDWSLSRILDAIFLKNTDIPQFCVFEGSYWFVPVYAISVLFAVTIIRLKPSAIPCLLIIAWLYYFLKNFSLINVDTKFFGVSFSGFFFYSCIILLGYKFYTKEINKKVWLFILYISFMSLILFYESIPNLSMQNYKFPLSYVYIDASMISISLIFLLKDWYKRQSYLRCRLLQYLGKNSLNFYISQGISSSIIYIILPFIQLPWLLKCLCSFVINVILAIVIGEIFIKIFWIIAIIKNEVLKNIKLEK